MTNQAPPLVDYDVFTADQALREAVLRYDGEGAVAGLASLGARAGSAQAQRWGLEANTHPPALRTHDRYGNRVDEVDFHPAWHELLQVAVGEGLHAAPWAPDAGKAAHLVRAAGFLVWSQVEAGHGCPVSMTYAAVPALRDRPGARSRVGAPAAGHVVRRTPGRARREAGLPGRHGHDREAGRLGRPRQHHQGRAARGRRRVRARPGTSGSARRR